MACRPLSLARRERMSTLLRLNLRPNWQVQQRFHPPNLYAYTVMLKLGKTNQTCSRGNIQRENRQLTDPSASGLFSSCLKNQNMQTQREEAQGRHKIKRPRTKISPHQKCIHAQEAHSRSSVHIALQAGHVPKLCT